MPEASSPPAATAGAFATLTGRCIDEDGRPLAGCLARAFDQYPGHGEKTEGEVAAARSREDGSFSVEVKEASSKPLLFLVQHEGRVARWMPLGPLTPGEHRNLGDVLIALGASLFGRVMDPDGRALPGVNVRFRGPALPSSDKFSPDGAASTQVMTDEYGKFRVTRTLRRARWSLHVFGRGAVLVRPESVDLGMPIDPVNGLVVVARLLPTISGRVTLENAGPVMGLQVQGVDPANGARVSELMAYHVQGPVTAEGGEFVLYPTSEAALEEEVILSFVDPRGFELVDRPGPLRWGTSDVKLVVRKSPSLELEVVEAGTGTPVEDYSISLREDEGLSFRNARNHAGGKLRLEGLRRARYRLFVLPSDPRLEPADRSVQVDDAAGAEPRVLKVALVTSPTLVVYVRLAGSSDPVVGTTVTLVDPKGAADVGVSTEFRLVFAPRLIFTYQPGDSPIALHQSKTDAAGSALLRVPRDKTRLFLRVEGDTHVPLARLLDPADFSRGSVDVEVTKGSRLEVVVTPSSVFAYHPRIRLGRPGAASSLFPLEGVAVRADGRCELDHVPPGTWEVFLCDGKHPLGEAVKTAQLVAGEAARVEISVPHLAPGTFDATVEGLGNERPQMLFCLTPDPPPGGPARGRRRRMVAIVQGRASFGAVIPGRYKAELLAGNGDEAATAAAREPIVIEPGTAWRGAVRFEGRSK